jgi:hypothetical protein
MMKKFSNITGQKVTEEPKKEVKQLNEEELFKIKLLSLMDSFLTVRMYGPVDNHQRAGLIKISGKELVVEAILDLLTEKSSKEQTKLLESLKNEVGNWEVIDSKIDFINREKALFKSRKRFNTLLENYTNESLIEKVQLDINKITKQRTLRDYIQLTQESKLSNETKTNLVKIYTDRLNQLD